MKWSFERRFDTIDGFTPFVLRAAEHYGCKTEIQRSGETAEIKVESQNLKAKIKIHEKTLDNHPFRRSLGPIKALDIEIDADGENAEEFYNRIIILSLRAFC